MISQALSKYRSNVIVNRFVKVLSVDVLVKASGFILLPIYLRLMTQQEYGLYGYLMSIIGLFALFLNFGLYVPQVKLYSNYQQQERGSLFFTINVLLFAFITIVLAGTYISGADYRLVSFMFSHEINYADYRTVIFLSVAISVFNLMVYSYFMAAENIRFIQLHNLAKLIIVNGVVLYFLYSSHSDGVLVRLKYAMISEVGILLFFGSFFAKKMRPKFRFDIAMRSLKIGIPVMLIAILNMFYGLSDRFILEKYSDFANLGIYNLGLTISGVVLLISTSFQRIYAPIFFKEKDPQVNFDKMKRILKYVVPLFIAACAGLILATWFFLYVKVIDRQYGKVVSLLPLLLVGSVFQSISHFYKNFMVYFEITYVGLIISIISNVINIALNIILIKKYSIYGAALATAIAGAIAFMMFWLFVKRKLAAGIDSHSQHESNGSENFDTTYN